MFDDDFGLGPYEVVEYPPLDRTVPRSGLESQESFPEEDTELEGDLADTFAFERDLINAMTPIFALWTERGYTRKQLEYIALKTTQWFCS